MAGLAPHAANFFKFLLILVLFTICMTLFVTFLSRPSSACCFTHAFSLLFSMCSFRPKEFPSWLGYIRRRPRAPSQRAGGIIPDDLRGLLRPPRLDSAGAAVAAVDVPAQVCARGADGERSQLGASNPGRSAGRARGCLRDPHYAPRAFFLVFFFFFFFWFSLFLHLYAEIENGVFSSCLDSTQRIITVTCSYYLGSSWVSAPASSPWCGSGCGRPDDEMFPHDILQPVSQAAGQITNIDVVLHYGMNSA